MITFPILSLLVFLPLAGVLFLLFVRGDAETVARNARNTAPCPSVLLRSKNCVNASLVRNGND